LPEPPARFSSTNATILGIAVQNSTQYRVTWSKPMVFNYGGGPDAGLTVNGFTPDGLSSVDSTHSDLFFGGGTSHGVGWNANSQPGWVTTVIAVPESGTVP